MTVESRSTTAFWLVAVGGVVLALVLGVRQAYDKPAVRVGDPRVHREGLVATAQVLARNHSDRRTYCPAIRVAARDRDGLDLEVARARPDGGDGRLAPGETVNFVATLRHLTAKDYDERLDEFRAYVFSNRRC